MSQSKPISSYLDDLAQGQSVIVIARWVLAVAGIFLILLDPGPLKVVRFQLMIVLGLAVSNFYLSAQIVMKKRTLESVIYGASLADLGVITAIVISQGGFKSDTFAFYFPAMLAMSLAFPTVILYLYLGTTVMTYALISTVTTTSADDFQVLIIRLLMLVAVAVCGNMYQRIESERRKSTVVKAESPMTETGLAAQS